MAKIDIIIPIYNQAKKLALCLDSIYNQTFKDYHIIIVNDGSTDDFDSVIKKYKTKLQVISQDNRGSNFARNLGYEKAQSEYKSLFLYRANIPSHYIREQRHRTGLSRRVN